MYCPEFINTVAKRETNKCWTGTHIYLFLLKYCSLFLKLSPCVCVFRIEKVFFYLNEHMYKSLVCYLFSFTCNYFVKKLVWFRKA